MRNLATLALTLPIAALSPGAVDTAVAAKAEAKVQARAGEDMATKCKREVFRKYGWRDERKGQLHLRMEFALAQIDQCLANGGKVM